MHGGEEVTVNLRCLDPGDDVGELTALHRLPDGAEPLGSFWMALSGQVTLG